MDIRTAICPMILASLSIDVGVDTHAFRPWHFDELQAVMKARLTTQETSALVGPGTSPVEDGRGEEQRPRRGQRKPRALATSIGRDSPSRIMSGPAGKKSMLFFLRLARDNTFVYCWK